MGSMLTLRCSASDDFDYSTVDISVTFFFANAADKEMWMEVMTNDDTAYEENESW